MDDLHAQLREISGVEGNAQLAQLVQHNAERPDIAFGIIRLIAAPQDSKGYTVMWNDRASQDTHQQISGLT